uniref:BHLH domain-containing protein n=1 Tax=Arion vulgaris TaxID=1028688 RepID=A0A0B7A4M2_9EUPU
MIAVGTDFLEPQLNSSCVNFTVAPVGDELPSLSCDLGDFISSSDIDQLLMQNFDGLVLPSESYMQLDMGAPDGESSLPSQTACELTSFLFEHTPRPRDLNLTYLEEHLTLQPQSSYITSLPSNNFHCATPPHSGGLTPTNFSRSTSPAWSESSGNMSTSSVPGGTLKESLTTNCSNPLPRHKRPSHKRAEIKRRDKIKTSLDDIKDYVPSLHNKGKLSESTILIKAAEYVHHLKDEHMERGRKVAELRREIECLSSEIQ